MLHQKMCDQFRRRHRRIGRVSEETAVINESILAWDESLQAQFFLDVGQLFLNDDEPLVKCDQPFVPALEGSSGPIGAITHEADDAFDTLADQPDVA
jgi:hypothetical protein